MAVAKEQIRQMISENNISSVADVYSLLSESFKDILQELMEAELDASLGYEKNQKGDLATSNKRNGCGKGGMYRDELTVAATLENLETVTGFIRSQLNHTDCPVALLTQIDVASEEIYVNIVRYAYHPQAGEATARCMVGGEPLQITIDFPDRGKPYNPLKKEDPDITLGAADRPVGAGDFYDQADEGRDFV